MANGKERDPEQIKKDDQWQHVTRYIRMHGGFNFTILLLQIEQTIPSGLSEQERKDFITGKVLKLTGYGN